MTNAVRWLIIVISIFLYGCKGNSPSSPAATKTSKSVVIAWSTNHEKLVNTAGGGYNVYYSNTAGFALAAATKLAVPYVSGTTAPTTTTLPQLAAGTYYIQVVAYTANGASTPSAETSITVP